jgi:hypothetical protein
MSWIYAGKPGWRLRIVDVIGALSGPGQQSFDVYPVRREVGIALNTVGPASQ